MKNYSLAAMLVFMFLTPFSVLRSAGRLPAFNIELHSIGIEKFPFVELSYTVTDPAGRAVSSLTRANFAVYENMRLVHIENLSMDMTPLSVVLLLDRSGSMHGSVEQLKMAARKFLGLLEARDRTMIIDFSDEPKVLCDFTGNREKLEACLLTMKVWGPTALYDSLYRSLLEVSEQPGRRVVIAMTDGTDQNEQRTAHLSRHTLKEVVVRAMKDKVPVYTIGLGDYIEKRELAWLAEKTGGRFFFAPSAAQLSELYLAVARNLKSRANLVYRSPEPGHDGKWREINLRIQTGGAPVGQTQQKYRAPGRYVLEITGQGWSEGKTDELEKELPAFVLRDHRLRRLQGGQPADLAKWLNTYFSRKK